MAPLTDKQGCSAAASEHMQIGLWDTYVLPDDALRCHEARGLYRGASARAHGVTDSSWPEERGALRRHLGRPPATPKGAKHDSSPPPEPDGARILGFGGVSDNTKNPACRRPAKSRVAGAASGWGLECGGVYTCARGSRPNPNITFRLQHRLREEKNIAVSILPGDAPIYFTTAASQSAYIRDASRTLEMSTDDIIRRITFGSQTYFTITSYTPSQELLSHSSERLGKGPITRRELLSAAIDFLVAKKANIKTCGTKVIIFYGQAFIKKMRLGEELCNIITTDKEQLSAIYREYHTDPKGPPSLKTALAGLIHLTPPVAASLLQLPHARLVRLPFYLRESDPS